MRNWRNSVSLRQLRLTRPKQMWKSIALTGACHIPSLRADRSLCLILKGCYVWKRRLTPQPQCQHSDKQDDICATLFCSGSLCTREIGRSLEYKGEEVGAGCAENVGKQLPTFEGKPSSGTRRIAEVFMWWFLLPKLALSPSSFFPSHLLTLTLSLISFTSCIFHNKKPEWLHASWPSHKALALAYSTQQI